MTPRPDELWIVETNSNGVETWKPIETFLETFDLTHDPAIILHSANNLRLQHQVPPREVSNTSSLTTHHILPHPEHSDVHFTEPFSAIPDHTNILQACWGRSAYHHSQGSTASLYWPPWRNTPESTQTFSSTLPMVMEPQPTPSLTPAAHAQDLRFQDGHLVPFGEMDISDTSVWRCQIKRKRRTVWTLPCSMFLHPPQILTLFSPCFIYHTCLLVSHTAIPSLWSLLSLFDTPWPADHTDLILILQPQKCLRLPDLKLHHGMDSAASLKKEDQTHVQRCRTDQFWSLWITLRYKNLRIKVYLNMHFIRPCIPTIYETLQPLNMRHCLLTHVFWNPMKSLPYKSNIYALSWWFAYVLNGASIFWPRIWSFVIMLILLGMSSRFPTLWPYSTFWMNIARTGVSASTIISIRLLWFRGLRRHSFFDCNVTKSAKELFSLEQLMHHNEPKKKESCAWIARGRIICLCSSTGDYILKSFSSNFPCFSFTIHWPS